MPTSPPPSVDFDDLDGPTQPFTHAQLGQMLNAAEAEQAANAEHPRGQAPGLELAPEPARRGAL